jgi:hypothetical protein
MNYVIVANFANVTILFSSSKLLKLKYIHHCFFLFSNEKITMRLMGREIR